MKKFTILLVSIFCLILFCGFDEDQTKVYDYANLLSQEEIDTLQGEAITLALQHQLDIIIATIDNAENKSSRQYANNFYDDNDFGYDFAEKSGILLLIDMDNREVYILGNGSGADIFPDSIIDLMTEKIAPHLTAGNYMKACQTFLGQVSARINTDNHSVNIIQQQLIYLGISLVVAIIAVVLMISSQKTKVTANGHTYMTNNKYNLRSSHDHFTRTTTVKRKIETQSSSSSNGGSSGGGGRSGGGRSF